MSQVFSLVLLVAGLAAAQAIGLRSQHPKYYWPHARGHSDFYSTTNLHGPRADLNTSLAWSWHHPDGRYHTVVVSAPLLDDKKNVYLASEDGLRKFSPHGEELWYYKPTGPVATCPSLMDGAIFGNSINGEIFAVDMETGKELWVTKASYAVAGDTAYVESHKGKVVSGVDPGPNGGALRVVGLDAKTGDNLWSYKSEDVLWNIMPMFTKDNAFIVMDIHGSVYKVDMDNGKELWRAGPQRSAARSSFSDGGVILGPDGTSYTCSNYEGSGEHGQRGALRAYALEDGHMLWEQVLDKPCNSWPVVTRDGTTVVVPSGEFVASPVAGNQNIMHIFGKNMEQMHDFSLSLGNNELKTYLMPERQATIRAFDAKTGEPMWSKDLPPYGRLTARGDEEGYLERLSLHHRDQCLPAQFGAPTISGDGTVYVGRADGNLYAVRPHGDEVTVDTFQTEAGFLHPGTSFAPGMMAVTSCDGLFVWNV